MYIKIYICKLRCLRVNIRARFVPQAESAVLNLNLSGPIELFFLWFVCVLCRKHSKIHKKTLKVVIAFSNMYICIKVVSLGSYSIL
jgi:hypothetical protein